MNKKQNLIKLKKEILKNTINQWIKNCPKCEIEQRIIQKINPKMFIRYNEKYNKLYNIISGKELI